MTSNPYDVVLLPDQEIAKKAMELSSSVSKHGTFFTLDGKNYFPHLSLYMIQLTESGLQESRELLSVIASSTNALTATACQYHYSHEYLDVEYVKTKEMEELQKNIIERLNPLRDGLRERDKERIKTASGEELDNILKYGYRSIGSQFAPHLTFTRFKDSNSEILSELPDPSIFNGQYSSLGIFKMGDHGTCAEPVQSWKLK
jgi:2'-5' RNA ligase